MIIGISGKFHSGKDTVANIIIKKRAMWQRRAFADSLKDTAIFYYAPGLRLPHLFKEGSYLVDGEEMSGRQILINMGAKLREVDEDIFVNYIFRDYAPYYDNVIITDVRYKNEANRIKVLGGILVRVNRPDYDYSVFPTEVTQSQSETDLDDYSADYVITNTSLESLEEQVENFLFNFHL